MGNTLSDTWAEFKQKLLDVLNQKVELVKNKQTDWKPWADLYVLFLVEYPQTQTYEDFTVFAADNKWLKDKISWWMFYRDETPTSFIKGWLNEKDVELFMEFLKNHIDIVRGYWYED
ncbi:MAG: hypothetical protein RXO36_06550 [Candidatus Nanopusillus acidilobi]